MSHTRRLPSRGRQILSAGVVSAVVSAVVLAGLIGSAEGAEAAPLSPHRAAKVAEMHQLSAHRAVRHAVASKSAPASAPKAIARALSQVRPQDDPPVDPPAPTPTDTLDVQGTNGVLALTATSASAFVQFQFDGTAVGSPVAADGATATADFASWGHSDTAHSVTLLDCTTSAPADCLASTINPVQVVLDNAAPVITAPAGNARVSGGFTVTATASGGGVLFEVDGVARGFDGTAPYTFTYSGSALSTGRHSITAVSCAADQSTCDGPTSAAVSIVSDSLHPRISALAPATFSPNGDRHYDTSTLSFVLPDPEYAVVTVLNSHGTVVRGPQRLGLLAKGTHTWVWNGRSQANHVVASGRYTITVSTTARINNVVVAGMASKVGVVDLQAPVAAGLTTSGSVYPYHDGFHDTLVVKFSLDERAAVRLTILDSKHRAIRAISATRNAGKTSMTWDARDSRGRVVKAGTYAWTLTLTDSVANVVHGAGHRLAVSAAHLVSKTYTVTRNGDSFTQAGASDSSCAAASTHASDYAHGVWLANDCEGTNGADVAVAFYDVALPAATVYNHLNVQVNGFSENTPTSIETGVGINGGSDTYTFPGFHEITTTHKGWYNLGTVNAAGHVSARRHANIGVSVDSYYAPDDFDVNQVRISLSYQVLK